MGRDSTESANVARMNRAEKRRQQKLARKAQKQAGQKPKAAAAPKNAPNIAQSLDLAVQLHNAGDLQNAEKIYRDLLQSDPDHPVALHLLGVIANQVGNYAAAEELISRAIDLKPDFAEAYTSLGTTLRALGRLDEVVERYHAVIDIQPGMAGAHFNLANTLLEIGRLDEAITHFRKTLELQPEHAKAHSNLGLSLLRRGEAEEAEECFRQAIALNPESAEAHNNLGVMLKDRGEAAEAAACLKQAIALNPGSAEAHNSLGLALKHLGAVAEAEGHFRQAITLNPGFANAHCNLGNAVRDLDRLTEAIGHYLDGLEIAPDHAEIHAGLASVYWQLGRIDEGLASCRKTVSLRPDDAEAHNNLLFSLIYSDLSDEEIYNEHRLWDRHFAHGAATPMPIPERDRDPDKRLRIGFVSGDLRRHSVTYFLLPLFDAHDREKVSFHCYSNTPASRDDEVTERLREMSDGWRCIDGVDDRDVAEMIRSDGIDILVDLSGHTEGHRLPLFAKRSAPIQVTWLGYPNTTGLSAMDYRFTDAIADPPGATGTCSAETLVRLPHGCHCYQPDDDAPEIAKSPMLENGYVTFGSFNNLAKITPDVVATWARILRAVPGSRLLIKNRSLGCPGARQRYEALFAAASIGPDRLTLLGRTRTTADHLALYGQIDLALDTFPFNGVTTTCEAMWMGVPLIALRGRRHLSRLGASLLSRVGLEALIAEDIDGYVERAIALAGDSERLAGLRDEMRERMQASPLCDGPRFAESMERAFREMWTDHCRRAD